MKWMLTLPLLVLIACSASKKVEGDKSTQVLLGKEEVVLTFERTLCFGMCPAYKIIIRNDGSCSYEGYKFTDKIGNFKSSISKDQFDAIVKEAGVIGFFSMKDEYDNPAVTDLPSVMTMIEGPNGPKNVLDRMEAPAELKRFEKYLDSILLNLNWTAVED